MVQLVDERDCLGGVELEIEEAVLVGRGRGRHCGGNVDFAL